MRLRSFAFASALLCFHAAVGEEEKLIGWRGETYDPKTAERHWDPLNLTASMQGDVIPLPASRSWVQTISWEPRSEDMHAAQRLNGNSSHHLAAFIYHNFISSEEAHHLINLASVEMHRSGGGLREKGEEKDLSPG